MIFDTKILIYLFVFIFGTIIGSFLNVVILRLNTGLSINGRSGCFSCGKKLSSRELVPILSFIFQKGKCRNCKSKISWQYPIVEFLTGIIFLATFCKMFFSSSNFASFSFYLLLPTYYYLLAFSLLIVIGVYDWKHKIIPDGLVYTFIGLSFIYAVFPQLTTYNLQLTTILSGPLLALPLFLLWFVSRGRWMGFGDVKLALGMGWFLGLTAGFTALVTAFYSGAVVGLGLIIFQKLATRKRNTRPGLNLGTKNLTIKSEIPFGPFLIFGLFLVFFFNINFFSSSLFLF